MRRRTSRTAKADWNLKKDALFPESNIPGEFCYSAMACLTNSRGASKFSGPESFNGFVIKNAIQNYKTSIVLKQL